MSYTGTSGNDTYTGNGDDETISGLGGNDTLDGGNGNDIVDGGDGDDRLSGGNGNDSIYSTSGTDKLLDGGAGDDIVYLGGVTINGNVLVGGIGTDTISLVNNIVFAMARFDARDAGFENFYNYWGYSITGTSDANRFDFSALTAVSRYGAIVYGLGGADILTGTNQNDIFYGGEDNDTLLGNAGADSLYGEGGDDTLNGGDGNDTLAGGTGNDTLTGGNDADTLSGETGNDTLTGGDGDDILDGGADNDSLSGGAGNDQLYLNAGSDTLADGGSGDDTIHLVGVSVKGSALVGGTGVDTLTIDGGFTLIAIAFDAKAAGFEQLYNYWGYTITATNDANRLDFSGVTAVSRYGAVVSALAGNDVLLGTSANDIFYGGDDNDRLTGNAGADSLYGENGNDIIDAGDGDDVADGGVGDDAVTGGAGNDSLGGGTGADTLDGGDGNDGLNGGDDDDILTGGIGDDTLDGGNGADKLNGGDGNDQLYLYGGSDLLASGGTGDDTVHLGAVILNANVITGGTGTDTLALDNNVTFQMTGFDAKAAGFEQLYNYWGYVIGGTQDANRFDFSTVTVTSRYGVLISGLAGNDTLIGTGAIDYLYGGDDNDALTGNAGADTLNGDTGDDTISGGDGGDSINGGSGADTLNGGNDADSIFGDTGDDTIVGGDGDDVLDGGADADTVSGGNGNDTITVNSGTDLRIDGGAGDDRIGIGGVTINAGVLTGGTGTDTLAIDNNVTLGTAAFDPFAAGFENFYNYWGYTFTGTAAADRYDFSRVTVVSRYGALVNGLGGNDVLTGTADSDYFYGGDDNDTLTGNSGADTLVGDAGDDTISGGEGGDALTGGTGNDTLDGGSEADSLAGNEGSDTLIGGSGDDVLDGGADADSMSGGSGNDTIYLYSGSDLLADGGADDDRIIINGAGPLGDGVLVGGAGTDTLDLSSAATFAMTRFSAADAGFENYYNYWGYQILGSSAANILDFSGMTAVSRYGLIVDALDGNDTIVGIGANDMLTGGAGDDSIEGGNGDDTLAGGDGIDVASYAGASSRVVVSLAAQGSVQDTLGAGRDLLTGFEGLTGSRFADTLTGDAGNNRLSGLGGADRLDGGDGADVLDGGAGNDTLIGGAARDTALYTSTWADYAVTVSGSGYQVADLRADGPDGVDTLQTIEQLRFANGTFAIADTINVGPSAANDAAAVRERGAADAGVATATGSVLANDSDANLLVAGLGETLTVRSVALNGGVASAVGLSTVIDGIYGTLTIAADGTYSYALDDARAATQALRAGESATESFAYVVADAHGVTATATLTVTVAGSSDTLATDDLLQVTIGQASALDVAVLTDDDLFAPGTTISGIANATGADVSIVDGKLVVLASAADASFDYTLTAANGETSTAHVVISGVSYTGRAVLTAVAGADAVDFVGGALGDLLTGSDGADRLVGGAALDKLVGNAGDDVLLGGDGADTLTGGAGNDVLDGGAGRDVASYASESERVVVDLSITGAQDTRGAGIDTLIGIESVTGGRGSDSLTGSEDANVLRGGGGTDTLVGNGGADTLYGGAGADVMTGGRAGDLFVYESVADFGAGFAFDRITDFSHAQGDRIDLSLIDVDAGTAGDQAFTFIGAAAFTAGSAAFELRAADNGDGTQTVQMDLNHDGTADYQVIVTSAAPLVAEDFVL